MSLSTRTLPQLFNGVSRQPAILRSIDQTEDELNSWAAVSSGVGKRPPTETLAKLTGVVGPDAFIHIINRDVNERYVVIIDGTSIRVFDFDGNEKTVNVPGGADYLVDADLTAVTVADYTFIVNRNMAVLMKDVGADTVAPPEYVRDPVRTSSYDETTGTPRLPGSEGGYAPNPIYTP